MLALYVVVRQWDVWPARSQPYWRTIGCKGREPFEFCKTQHSLFQIGKSPFSACCFLQQMLFFANKCCVLHPNLRLQKTSTNFAHIYLQNATYTKNCTFIFFGQMLQNSFAQFVWERCILQKSRKTVCFLSIVGKTTTFGKVPIVFLVADEVLVWIDFPVVCSVIVLLWFWCQSASLINCSLK